MVFLFVCLFFVLFCCSCPPARADMPGSVQSALFALLDVVVKEDYVRVVREVALVGGCNCSRASLVGACLGAKFGLDAIPLDWMQKTSVAGRALSLAIRLVKDVVIK